MKGRALDVLHHILVLCENTHLLLHLVDFEFWSIKVLWFSFIIFFSPQANTTDELPERLIGAVRVSHIELSSAIVPKLDQDPSWLIQNYSSYWFSHSICLVVNAFHSQFHCFVSFVEWFLNEILHKN